MTSSMRTLKTSALPAGESSPHGVARRRPSAYRPPSCRCSALSALASSGFAWTTAGRTPWGTPASVCAFAASKDAVSRERCSSNAFAATSGALPATSSAACAMASDTPRQLRTMATPAARFCVPLGRAGLAPGCARAARGRPSGARALEARLEGVLSPSSPVAVRTEMEIEPSPCFRAKAGRRQVGHRVASRIVLAHRSRQAA
mmetsp:Transcript_20720/g.60038  ORF Transcript_20720/g.60038 Transcript_20720/m.60038 type:complete len:203 (-) Transcript_20720:111-719(-)